MNRVRLLARAKVNLVLRVIDKRDDGYHDVETVMQALELTDHVTLERADTTRISIAWEAEEGPILERPDLVERAIEAFCAEAGRKLRIEAGVLKRIPIGAGLGGGSADAAAALLGLSEMEGRPLSAETLFAVAAGLGSDVPFALQGGTAYAAGRGERIRALPTTARFWWVIGVPDFALGTASVYEAWDRLAVHDEGARGAFDDLKDALRKGDVDLLAPHLHNDLEIASLSLQPDLRSLKEQMVGAGAVGAVMAGSGSAIAGLCREESHAREVAASVLSAFRSVFVVASATRGTEIVDAGGPSDRFRPSQI